MNLTVRRGYSSAVRHVPGFLCLLVAFSLAGGAAPHSVAAHTAQATATDAAATVSGFYTALDGKDLTTAYALLSPRFQATQPFAAWQAGYATTAAIGSDVFATGDPATIAVYLTAIDTAADFSERVSRFAGVWSLVPDGGGGWLLDRATIQVADEPATAAAPAMDFSRFAEGWSHHGFGLTVDVAGTAVGDWRTYQWCADNPTPPCNDMSGNSIIDGGHGAIAFTAAIGSSAVGVVTSSTDPVRLAPGGVATLTLLPFDMAVLVQPGSVLVLCGTSLSGDRPFVVQQLCGA